MRYTFLSFAFFLLWAPMEGTEKTAEPEFDWERIWPAASVANTLKDGKFTDEQLQRLAKFPIVKLVCTRRNNDWNKLEAEARARLKELRPGICLLEYQNSLTLGDMGAYEAFTELDWKLTSPSGKILGDARRPDEYIYADFRKASVREEALKQIESKLDEPHIDGIFFDSLVGFQVMPNKMRKAGFLEPAIEAWLQGYEDLLRRAGASAQKRKKLCIGNLLRARNFEDAGLSVLKQGWLDGSYAENMIYEDPELQAKIIDALIAAGQEGFMLVQNPDREVTEKLSEDGLDYAKAIFLVSMSDRSYLMYGVWGNIRLNKWQQPFDFVDDPKSLGEPVGPAKKKGFVYTRSFKHADVWVDVGNQRAKITWK